MACTLSAVVFSSCAVTDIQTNTPDEVKTMQQARVTHSAIGAIVGASAVYGVAKLSGKSDKQAKRMAVAGGVLGLIGGDQMGQRKGARVVREKRRFAYTERQLNAKISKAKTFNTSLAKFNSRIRREISLLKQTRGGNAAKKKRLLREIGMAERQAKAQVRSLGAIKKANLSKSGRTAVSVQLRGTQSRSAELKSLKARLNNVN